MTKLNTPAFKGYKACKNDEGTRTGEFSFPFDPETTDCYLEIAVVDRDIKTGNYFLTGDKYPDLKNNGSEEGRKLFPGKNRINIHAEFGVMEDEPFAYHYKLIDKKTGVTSQYGVDAGALLDERDDKKDLQDEAVYNLHVPASDISRGGSMLLAVPDNLDPKWVYDSDNDIIVNENYDELKHNIRLFSNKMGGSLAGMEKKLESGAFGPYDRIVSLPLFTDDSRSHHAYWNKNCMQMALSLGNINNYTSLTRKLFAQGKSLVSDGAFVNEGLEGIHFHHALKWKEQSPFFNWFRMDPNNEVLFGVFTQNTDFLSHRIVNPEYFYIKDEKGMYVPCENENYDSNKPTYFETYDKELLNAEKLDPQEPIKSYDKDFYDKPLSKNTHQDTVIPYRFQINPREYDINVQRLNEYNKNLSAKVDLYSGFGTKYVAQFSNLSLDEKIEGNVDTWNANSDITKIHYFISNAEMENILSLKPGADQKEEIKKLEYASNEAKDYVITSAHYWTKKTKDILNLYTAQNLKNLDADDPKAAYRTILKKVQSGSLPERIKNNLSEETVKNILNGKYELKGNKNTDEFKDQVARAMMNVPLDSIEFGEEISAVFATPYISKRSCREDYIGVPDLYNAQADDYITYDRFFLHKAGNPHLQTKYAKVYDETNRLFVGDESGAHAALTDFAVEIIDRLNEDRERPEDQKIHNGFDNTEYGNYVVPILAEEILKFAVIKSLCDAPRFQTNDNGDISYDYNRLKKITLKDIGINHSISPEDEARQLIRRVKSGLNNITESDKEALADALKKKIKGTTAESFRLAEAIVDRTQSGLDWRIDAAKDIADVDSLKNDGETDFDTTFEHITSFWGKFSRDILKENPSAYLTAELTDMMSLYDEFGEGSKRYPDRTNLIGKFLTDSNLTTIANYDFFFSTMPEIFAKNFNNGQSSQNQDFYLDKILFNVMVKNEPAFVRSAPLQALMYSYTFLNNHDNTRALHTLALDPDFFHGIVNNWTQNDHRKEAIKLLTGDYDSEPTDIDSFNFDRVSSKDLAMVSALQKGFFAEIDNLMAKEVFTKDRGEFIKEALRDSLTELANGQYDGTEYEMHTFGVKPIDTAIDLALENARNAGYELSEKECKILSEKTFERVMKPAYEKYCGMMEFLVALPGNPTLYSGDDLGATGFEYETKNVTLQNRSYIHNEWADKHSAEKRPFIAEFNNKLRGIMHTRKKQELQALNDGAIFTLKPQLGTYDGSKQTRVTSILRENTAGYMALSLFNTSGAEANHDAGKGLTPNTVSLEEIDLSQADEKNLALNVGLPAGLPLKTIFFDANNEKGDLNDIYVVEKNSLNKYCIKHRVKDTDGRYKEAPIEITGNTMILYHDPKQKLENISFKGRKFLYNPQYQNLGAQNLYREKSNTVCGEKLSLVSR